MDSSRPAMDKISAYLPSDLALKVRLASVVERRQVSQIVADALTDYFKNRPELQEAIDAN